MSIEPPASERTAARSGRAIPATRGWSRRPVSGTGARSEQPGCSPSTLERGVLLQHRVSWSHYGDTWALPGGARHEGESASDGALREAAEEAGVPDAAVRPRLLSVLELGYWTLHDSRR